MRKGKDSLILIIGIAIACLVLVLLIKAIPFREVLPGRTDPQEGGQQEGGQQTVEGWEMEAEGSFLPAEIPDPIQLDTSGLVRVPDPQSEDNPRFPEQETSVPAVGDRICDAALGTCFTRVTESAVIRHEYARFDPFNADKSLVVLRQIHEGSFDICRTAIPYDAPANLVARLDMEEPRWHREDPDLILGLNGFRIQQYNVKTGTTTLVKDFAGDPVIGPIISREPDLYRVTMKDEGESSWDGRWWALALQGSGDDYRLRYVFTWDRSADSIPGLLELRPDQSEIDWLGMSPKGSRVIIGSDSGNGAPLDGTVTANCELTEFHRINYDIAHADVGLDTGGNEVLVMQNSRTDYIDLLPIDPSTQPIMEPGDGYEGTGRVPLVRLYYDWSSPITFDGGVHISCNSPGWAVVSTYNAPGTPERNWLDRSIVLVRLDRNAPDVFYLAKTHNTTGEYWEETHATISNDGRTVLWAANFGVEPGNNRISVLRLDLP
ncbi:hypothetical protein [Anaerotalea alkaliphila]|uniref:Uncharacterized protein n=1 Tax=Anaerotalea alkaliphila TaxID=2662126 RepID=A0A7X5HW93_9FIRM|nr:hypothetical protein [Anaerotalea alkaliphila]NDL67797.1 hypothetical protein [Anaerotalea alkaliphila]